MRFSIRKIDEGLVNIQGCHMFLVVVIAEKEIAKQDGSVRTPRDSFRAFLLTTLAATLNGNGQRLIHQFCDMYDMARHDPNEFGNDEYEAYRRLLLKLLDAYVFNS